MWIWFAIAAVAVILELLTGTFVLLLVGLGAMAAGLAVWFELDIIVQLAVLAIIPVVGIFILKRMGKFHLRNPLASESDVNLNLDIGKSVFVEEWLPERRLAQVSFRGAQWQTKPSDNYIELRSGKHKIVAIRGIVLIVEPIGDI
ncbi:MAG: NfeD family protein [Alcaligenaceae bacterium]|nr:NfeD family protein [Alcaligenaceae bacterium]